MSRPKQVNNPLCLSKKATSITSKTIGHYKTKVPKTKRIPKQKKPITLLLLIKRIVEVEMEASWVKLWVGLRKIFIYVMDPKPNPLVVTPWLLRLILLLSRKIKRLG